MSNFSRQDLKDMVTAIDITTGAYTEHGLEESIKNMYRNESAGFHRLRSVVHRLKAALSETPEQE